MGIFYLYKIVHGDFLYFLNLSGFVRFARSYIFRFTVKIVTNLTMLMQMRHPNEMGGLPFLVSILTSVVGR